MRQQAVRLALRAHLVTMVGLPVAAYRAWENVSFTPTLGTTWIAESYLPGPTKKITVGALGEMETLPQYVVQVNVPANGGTADELVDDILTHFAPETSITVTGATLRVRGDVAPFASQLIQSAPGFATVTINIPLRLRAANVI